MKTAKQLLSSLLAFVTVGCVLASCGETVSEGKTETDAATDDAAVTEAVTEAPTELEQLPAADYEGYEFRILLNNQDDRFVDVMTEDEETGDVMNDIVYRRNRAVEEQFHVKLTGTQDEYTKVNDTLKKEVQAGLNEHDLFFSNCYATTLASGGFLYVLNDLPNLDLKKPYWDAAALEGMSVAGKVYLVTGDVSPTSMLTSSCLVFNKKLFSNNDMEFPYALAADGKWTIDVLADMTKDLTQDLNGDGKYTMGDDLFSFSSWMCDSPYSLFYGAGGTLSKKNSDDIPEVSIDTGRITAIYDKIYQIIIDTNSYFVTDAAQYPTTYQNFANGDAYFCEITLQKIDAFLRDMEDDYGILPIPKWDEAQKTYLSCVNGAGGFVVVPNNAEDPERTGMIFEALAAGAYDMISPSLYDVITKTRNVRDEDSVEMVNLITRQRVFDPFYINLCTGYDFAQSLLSGKSKEVASKLASMESPAIAAMEKVVKAYTESVQ